MLASSMKFRNGHVAITACGIVALLILSFVLNDRSHRGPTYAGKSLEEWLDDYDMKKSRLSDEACKAVQALGTNCLPALEEMFQRKESRLTRGILKLNEIQSVMRLRVTVPQHYYGRANSAFIVLGQTAEPAIPALIRCLADPTRQPYAVIALAAIGEKGTNAIHRALVEYDPDTRARVKQGLIAWERYHRDRQTEIRRFLETREKP